MNGRILLGALLLSAAAVWKHAAKDRGVTIVSGIGKPETRVDFRDDGSRGRKNL